MTPSSETVFTPPINLGSTRTPHVKQHRSRLQHSSSVGWEHQISYWMPLRGPREISVFIPSTQPQTVHLWNSISHLLWQSTCLHMCLAQPGLWLHHTEPRFLRCLQVTELVPPCSIYINGSECVLGAGLSPAPAHLLSTKPNRVWILTLPKHLCWILTPSKPNTFQYNCIKKWGYWAGEEAQPLKATLTTTKKKNIWNGVIAAMVNENELTFIGYIWKDEAPL